MLESEIQHHILNKQTIVVSSDDHSISFLPVATSIDAQALPRNKQDRAAFLDAMALKVTFWSVALAQYRSILIGQ